MYHFDRTNKIIYLLYFISIIAFFFPLLCIMISRMGIAIRAEILPLILTCIGISVLCLIIARGLRALTQDVAEELKLLENRLKRN